MPEQPAEQPADQHGLSLPGPCYRAANGALRPGVLNPVRMARTPVVDDESTRIATSTATCAAEGATVIARDDVASLRRTETGSGSR